MIIPLQVEEALEQIIKDNEHYDYGMKSVNGGATVIENFVTIPEENLINYDIKFLFQMDGRTDSYTGAEDNLTKWLTTLENSYLTVKNPELKKLVTETLNKLKEELKE